MAALPDTTWKVLPHRPLTQLADNLWHAEGDLPGMALKRRMVVVRLESGDLVLHNGIALDEEGMRLLESLGRPAWLVVPNGWHRLDAARFKARYPELKVVCPRDSKSRVEQMVPVDATYDTFTPTRTVWFEHFGGKKAMEGAMLVRSADGVTAVLGDSLFNVPHQHGFFGWFYGRVLGNFGGPKVTLIGRLFLLAGDGRAAYKAWLERTAGRGDLVRVVPGHGDVIDKRAAEVLRQVAGTL